MKKFLSVLLLLIMVISIIVISAVSASAEVTEHQQIGIHQPMSTSL